MEAISVQYQKIENARISNLRADFCTRGNRVKLAANFPRTGTFSAAKSTLLEIAAFNISKWITGPA